MNLTFSLQPILVMSLGNSGIDVGSKINIDVLTLNSIQCAVGSYMLEAIAALPKDIHGMIEYTEWSIKSKEGMAKFLELTGRVLPTIYIQGDLVFQCKIPRYEELIDAMAARAPQPEIAERIKSLRYEGFDFAKIQESLAKVGSDLKTKAVSRSLLLDNPFYHLTPTHKLGCWTQ